MAGLGRCQRFILVAGLTLIADHAPCGRGLVFHFGMDWLGCDNRRLALNIMHWLSWLIN